MNVFGPLMVDPVWFSGVMSRALGAQGTVAVDEVAVEYFHPRPSQGLGDRTTIDVLVPFVSAGERYSIAIETKLADRFNSRSVRIGAAYGTVMDIWARPDVPHNRSTSQLARIHALAEFEGRRQGAPRGRGAVLVIRHDEDESASRVVRAYSDVIADSGRLFDVTIGRFLGHMQYAAKTAVQRETVDGLRERYSNLGASEQAWREIRAQHAQHRPPETQ